MSHMLAIVPARSGSKGVLGKNTRHLAGKPLISYTIQAALKSAYALRLVVSTDDPRIAEVALAEGAEAPFIRPKELALDTTPTLPVVQHALEWLDAHEGYRPDVVLLLQPTSPLRTSQHIDAGIRLLLESGADSVISVCEAEHSPYWMWQVDGKGRATRFMQAEPGFTSRQVLPAVHRTNGALYITRRNTVIEEGRLLGDAVRALVMERCCSVDVDTEEEFLLAELIMERLPSQGGKSGSMNF